MKAIVDIQIVWNENKGEVQLFIGDFRIGLPPVLCAQLERDLAAARRVPERAREMAALDNGGGQQRAFVAYDEAAECADQATILMGGDSSARDAQ